MKPTEKLSWERKVFEELPGDQRQRHNRVWREEQIVLSIKGQEEMDAVSRH